MFNCTYNYTYKEKELKKAISNKNQYLGTILIAIMLAVSIYGIVEMFLKKRDMFLIASFMILSFLALILLITLIIGLIKNIMIYKNSLGINQIVKFENNTLYYSCGKNEFSIPVKYITKIKKTKYFYVFELDSEDINEYLINPQIPHRGVRLPDLVLLARKLNVNLELM